MPQFEKVIKKIGQLTYFFTDMDTIFIDKDSNIIWEYGHTIARNIGAIYKKNS